jgi:hypothetical protein
MDADQSAMPMLRGALSRGPQPASHIEEMAEKKGIGLSQLEHAKAQLGVTAKRLGDGLGVCLCFPKQAAAEA